MTRDQRDMLLFVLLKRLGGKVTVSAHEINAARGYEIEEIHFPPNLNVEFVLRGALQVGAITAKGADGRAITGELLS